MSPDEKQALIEKIDTLPPDQRKRVEGYVDALVERQLRATKTGGQDDEPEGAGSSGRGKEGEEAAQVTEMQDSQDRFLRQDWAGALSGLKHEYASLKLEEEIKKQWMKMIHD